MADRVVRVLRRLTNHELAVLVSHPRLTEDLTVLVTHEALMVEARRRLAQEHKDRAG